MKKILLAGATGYLGNYILSELLTRGFETRVVVRNDKKIKTNYPDTTALEIFKGELTQAQTINHCCDNIDTVISTVGITKQKDGFTYLDVDFQANVNLLEEALKSGVRKFIYISILDGDKLNNLKICEAKEKFVSILQNSKIEYCIVRPTGYYSDMGEFFEMAQKGSVFLFGKGGNKMNPIHGIDLAKVCVDTIENKEKELKVGGPEIFTYNEIATLAFNVLAKKSKIKYIPNALSKLILFLLRNLSSSKFYGPIEFFMTVLSRDLVAPKYGENTLKKYFISLKSKKEGK